MLEKEVLEKINTVEEIATEIEIAVGRSRTFLNILLNSYFDDEEANWNRCLVLYRDGKNLVGAVNDYVYEVEKKLKEINNELSKFWNNEEVK